LNVPRQDSADRPEAGPHTHTRKPPSSRLGKTRTLGPAVTVLGLLVFASSCTNAPPVLEPIPNQVVEAGDALDLLLGAEDPDGNPLTFFAERLPDGAALDTSTGRLLWTPQADDPRDYYVTLGVRDDAKPPGEDSQNVMLSVIEPGSRAAFGTLRVSLVDAATGEPRPARIQIRGSDGRYYGSTFGIPRCLLSGGSFFYTHGAFQAQVPPGPLELTVTCGPEYVAFTDTLTVPPGGTAERDYPMVRWAHAAEEGWYSGDVHIHTNYGLDFIQGTAPVDRLRNTPEDMLLMARAEDLNVSNFLVSNSLGDGLFDRESFEGKPHAGSTARHILYWNQEFRSPLYGHLGLLNLNTLVSPSNTGYDLTSNPYDYPANALIADRTHAQGGLVIQAHPAYFEDDFASLINPAARELAVDVALGKIDAVEILSYASSADRSRDLWYRMLNCGYRIPAVAGTDSFMNFVRPPFCHNPPGGNRVYVQVEAGFDYASWIQGLRTGQSFVTNGALLSLSVNGRPMGSEISFPGPDPVHLAIQAEVRSPFPMDTLEIVRNGQVIFTQPAGEDRQHIQVSLSREETESCWIAARAGAGGYIPFLFGFPAVAHTNPVYVTREGRPLDSLEDRAYFLAQIDRLEQVVGIRNRFASSQDRASLLALLEQARAIHRAGTGSGNPSR